MPNCKRGKQDFVLGFDASSIRGNKTGVEYYALSLYRALKRELGGDRLLAFSRDSVPEIPEARIVPSRMPLFLWRQIVLPAAIKREGINSFHSPVTAIPWRLQCPSVATVHDLSYRLAAKGVPAKSLWSQKLNCLLAVYSCRNIVAVSETTCGLLRKYYPAMKAKFITVLSGALAKPRDSSCDTASFAIQEPYLVQLGRIDERKSPLTTLEAFRESELYRSHTLLFIGSPGNSSPIVHDWLSRNQPVARKVILAGYLPEAEVHVLLQSAEALVYPSLDEGFGFPPFEALAAGTVPIVSDIPVTRELLGDAALYAPPGNVQLFAEKMKDLSAGRIEREQILAAGQMKINTLTWERTGREIIKIHAALMED